MTSPEAPESARPGPDGGRPDHPTEASPPASPHPIRLALLGVGRMGNEVARVARARGHEIVLTVGHQPIAPPASQEIPRLTGPEPLRESEVEVAIDFSVGGAALDHVRHCASAGTQLVLGTTGWDEDRARVEATARDSGMGLLHAPNFSLGVNLFLRIVTEATRLVEALGAAGDFDASISEAHHRHKVDHPSGTARRMAEIVVANLRSKERWSERLPETGPVDPDVLQIAVTRAGEISGIHTLGLEGPDDRIELRHEARGRRGFALGAVVGAEWIRDRRGVFSMEDLLGASLTPHEEPR